MVVPALLLLVAPALMRAYDAVSVSIRALAMAVRTMRAPARIVVMVESLAEPCIQAVSYVVVHSCPYVAPNAYLRAFYRAFDNDYAC